MAIRLMRAIEVPESPRDRVYSASRLHAVIFVVLCLCACAAMIWFHWPQPRLAYYISGVIVIFLLLGHQFFDARFRASNWLVRVADAGLYIHFRSYLNDHLSAEDPTVAFLPYQDIRSARLVKEHVKTRDMQGAVETQTQRYVELEVAADPAPLAGALAAECARPGAWEKRWYGRSQTLYRDYPVLMQSPPFVRIAWQVVPRAAAFLDALQSQVTIAPEVVISEDFANLESLTRDQQEKRLRDLNQRGQTIAAVYMARKLYGLDLTAATNFVKTLSGETQS